MRLIYTGVAALKAPSLLLLIRKRLPLESELDGHLNNCFIKRISRSSCVDQVPYSQNEKYGDYILQL